MAEVDTEGQSSSKEGQVSDMDPRQSDKTGPIAPASEPAATLEADLQAHIGRQLRLVYDEVVNEPVPDRFLKLLEDLERSKAERS